MTVTAPSHHTLKPGGTVEIILEGNPSTGYDWDTSDSDAASRALVAIADLGIVHDTEGEPARPGLVGAPVNRRWRITALKPGTAHLIFSYRRSWESAPPIRTHKVIVTTAE